MRIDSFSTSADVHSREVDRTSHTQSEQSGREVSGRGGGDSASISPLAQQLAQALDENSPAQVRRVEQTQEALQSGHLNVTSSEIADSLISDALTGSTVEARLSARG